MSKFLGLSIVIFVILVSVVCGNSERKRKVRSNPQKIALETWAKQLSPRDYNYTEWRSMFNSRSTVDFFNGYAKRLSGLFNEANAKVNFVMVGACDGTGDITIKNLYVPNDHWRGVFVEPLTMNVRDLIKYMADKKASHRSVIIHAAATETCAKPTIVMERPLYEEKNASIPHWLRRQIGSLLPEKRDKPRNGWTTEEVRCVTATDILNDWSSMGQKGGVVDRLEGSDSALEAAGAAAAKKMKRRRRPHVLKIDVEGHDYEVLMSFLKPTTPIEELPLLIDFEAKSIAKKFPVAKEQMEQLGYIVSPFGQDGFALLTAEKIFKSIKVGGMGGGRGDAGGDEKSAGEPVLHKRKGKGNRPKKSD